MKSTAARIHIFVLVCLLMFAGSFAFSQGELDTSVLETALGDSETGGVTSTTQPASTTSNENGGTVGEAAMDLNVDAEEPQLDSIWFILKASGSVGLIIILLSIAAGTLAIEHLITIRRSTMIPQELADRLFQLIKNGDRAKALELCKANPGFLSNVIMPALLQPWSHWEYVEKAVEDALADQAGRLYRKIDWLSLIGNIAPMLGLLGTVIGMIVAFRNLSLSDGMAGADLSEGIYLALVTTVEGLVVAIPTLTLHSLFTNRITTLAGDVAYTAEQILRPIKFAVRKTDA